MPKSKKCCKKSIIKRRRTNRKKYIKGGSAVLGSGPNIPNYALNTYQHDPNYMQISSRNVLQHGSGKYSGKMKSRSTRMKRGGALLDFVANQFSNVISNFPSTINYGNNEFVPPISNTVYTGAKVPI